MIDDYQLFQELKQKNEHWQEVIFEKTGIYVEIRNHHIRYYSNCGWYDEIFDESCDESVEKSISNIISMIESSSIYSEILVDRFLGQFTKSQLFWGIYDSLIIPKRYSPQHKIYNCPVPQPDGSYYIRWDDYLLLRITYDGFSITCEYDLCDYTYVENSFDISDIAGMDLSQVIQATANLMEETWTKEIKEDNECQYDENDEKIRYEVFSPQIELIQNVPKTLEELKQRFSDVWKQNLYTQSEIQEMGYRV